MNKFLRIFLEAIPILVMIIAIPIFLDDYVLAGVYCLIVAIAFVVKYEKQEWIVFCFGLVVMIVSEYFFISTGVESFKRTSLFGVMPIWLPLLWAYAFVAIKRAVKILDLK